MVVVVVVVVVVVAVAAAAAAAAAEVNPRVRGVFLVMRTCVRVQILNHLLLLNLFLDNLLFMVNHPLTLQLLEGCVSM